MPKTLKEASIIELKAELYDSNVRISREQELQKIITQELISRQTPPTEAKNEKTNTEGEAEVK